MKHINLHIEKSINSLFIKKAISNKTAIYNSNINSYNILWIYIHTIQCFKNIIKSKIDKTQFFYPSSILIIHILSMQTVIGINIFGFGHAPPHINFNIPDYITSFIFNKQQQH